MFTKKNIIITIIIILGVAGVFYFLRWQEPKEFEPIFPNNQQATSTEDEITIKYNNYLTQGIKYKGEGDAGNKESYYKAIDEFKKAAEISENKVWIPFLNLGNVYRAISDFQKAEEAYNQALKISTGDPAIYFAKIDLYRYNLKKSNAEIKALYQEALSKALDNSNLVMSYAAFLRDIGEYKESLKYYEALLKSYPDNENIKKQIEDLKAK